MHRQKGRTTRLRMANDARLCMQISIKAACLNAAALIQEINSKQPCAECVHLEEMQYVGALSLLWFRLLSQWVFYPQTDEGDPQARSLSGCMISIAYTVRRR